MKNRDVLLTSILLATMFAGTIQNVKAQTFAPEFHGEISFEVQNDWAFDTDDADAEVNTLFTTIAPYLVLTLTEGLAIEASLVFEPVQGTDPGDDTFFDNEGLYAEELKLSYTGNDFSLFAGKFNPSFGTAWDLAPGIWGVDFAEDYEVVERIGLGGSYTFGTEQTGDHTITGNSFFADTTFLSESTITRRGEVDKSDGGISNTEDLSSYSVTLDSEKFAGIESLNTHLGYRNQSEGDVDVGLDRESGYVVGVNYAFPVGNDVGAEVLAEWVNINDIDGTDDDVNYITTSLALTIYDSWNFSASYTGRDTDVTGGPDVDDHVYQFSAGYEFESGITVDLGYRGSEEAGIDTDIIGGLIAYTYEF